MIAAALLALASALPLASGHVAFWHSSMWGFNVTDKDFPQRDNRPVAPLRDLSYEQWWFHDHLDYPPAPDQIFELPAGKPATAELSCSKGATSFWESTGGGDFQEGDNVCPKKTIKEFHTTGKDNVKGCALAIAYKSDVSQVQPEDFTVFSVNQTCVWTRHTDFQVPERMPPCPNGKCICAWFWIHSIEGGAEENYMNGFQCNVTGSTSNVPLAKPQLPRRCGADPQNNKPDAVPGNCTYGAKAPFYWKQRERNNMYEGDYQPPFYNDLYNFLDGAQNDIFEDSYPNGIPPPSPTQTIVPTPNLGGGAPAQTTKPSGGNTRVSSSPSTAPNGQGSTTAASGPPSSSQPAASSATPPAPTTQSAAPNTRPAPSQSATASSNPSSPQSSKPSPSAAASAGGECSLPASQPPVVSTTTVISTVLVTVTADASAATQTGAGTSAIGNRVNLVASTSSSAPSAQGTGQSGAPGAAPGNGSCKRRERRSDSSAGIQEEPPLVAKEDLPGYRRHRRLTGRHSW
ncbi:hypothetical protein BD413DRAFT_292056 [Trametes elegans]|nr:hypothetical protein BD413DRAFT_292056 [Trametes elegans]